MTADTRLTIRPQHRSLGDSRLWLAFIGTSAFAVATLLAGPAQAAPAITSYGSAGHPAASAEIVTVSETTLAKVRGDISWVRAQFGAATMASPAAWRLHEELDRLVEEAKVLDQLQR